MKKRYLIIAASIAILQGCTINPPYHSRVSVGVGSPGAHIGIHISTYPDLVPIPGYPVYYAPGLHSNYFFYDGLYWVFHGDNWYMSGWYNGPWRVVGYYDVPVFILRVPVRYYRVPPPFFHGWHADAPPRWGHHWGRDWEERRRGWDHWDRHAAPPPAPLPHYQRNYYGDRYPREEQQHAIRSEHYRYQPRDPAAQEHFERRVQQDQQRERDQRRQPEQPRQEQERERYQRQQDEQREQYRQRQLEEQQREQYQRQIERQRQQEQQYERYPQRQPEQQRPQDQQREQSQQRRQEPQSQQQDRERQRSQPDPRERGSDDRGAPQERGQRDRDVQQEYERKRRGNGERDQYR